VWAFRRELDRLKPTYLVGRSTGHPLPDHVRAVCVEMHPAVVGVDAIQSLLAKLIGDGRHGYFMESGSGVAFMAR
jgi:hypothetical protein